MPYAQPGDLIARLHFIESSNILRIFYLLCLPILETGSRCFVPADFFNREGWLPLRLSSLWVMRQYRFDPAILDLDPGFDVFSLILFSAALAGETFLNEIMPQ